MYPDFQYLFESLFKTSMPSFLSVIKTFGFFVALAFLAAAWILKKELQRKEALGLLQLEYVPFKKAKKYIPKEDRKSDISEKVPVYPHQRVGDIVFIALIGGLIGAKVFNALESWNEFIHDPIGMLISGSGLTFYGGLIVAAGLIIRYLRKHKISVAHFCNAIAPALMLAYGIGRLGCHFSGDDDWGMFNSAYISLPDASVQKATSTDFDAALHNHSTYFATEFGNLASVPHKAIAAPAGFPTRLFAANFSHNVSQQGVLIPNCTGNYCRVLPVPVFPTSLYEAILCIGLFFLLWQLRKKLAAPFQLFGLYLLLNGLERLFIEKIKVNYRYNWGFLHPAQSEIIAVGLALLGIGLLFFYQRKKQDTGEGHVIKSTNGRPNEPI
jgi:phosphatidylglycerol---prolipoprotein diacylglyceryl transferase